MLGCLFAKPILKKIPLWSFVCLSEFFYELGKNNEFLGKQYQISEEKNLPFCPFFHFILNKFFFKGGGGVILQNIHPWLRLSWVHSSRKLQYTLLVNKVMIFSVIFLDLFLGYIPWIHSLEIFPFCNIVLLTCLNQSPLAPPPM